MGIALGIGSLGIAKSSSPYWTQQKINDYCLFFASDSTSILNKVVATQLPNQVTGSSDYLTVTGSGLNARYRTPDNATYRTADSDYVFWKSDASESTCDGNRLIAYDFPRILVKYLNVSPYTILRIAILKPGVTVTNGMRDAFDLSKWWDNTLSDYGVIKGNRAIGQSIWGVIPAIISDISKVTLWTPLDDLTIITKSGVSVSKVVDKNATGVEINSLDNPTWSTGKITYDGVNNIVQGAFVLIQPTFIFLVIKPLTWVNNAVIMDGKSLYGGLLLQSATSPGIKAQAGTYSDQNDGLIIGDIGIIRLLFNGASSKLIVNNGTPTTGNFGTSPMDGITIPGKANYSGTYANIEEYEKIIFKATITSQNETDVYNYLANKYGKTII